jgi:heptosyltransferase-1
LELSYSIITELDDSKNEGMANVLFKNILIVKLSSIGDVVHALPVAHALKLCYPGCRITWIVDKMAYELVNSHPDIDEVILFEKTKYKSLFFMLRLYRKLLPMSDETKLKLLPRLLATIPTFNTELRKYNFDLALDLQGLFKSSILGVLSGASTRLVYENAKEGSQYLSQRISGELSKGHVVDRYLDVVRYLGCNVDKPVFNITLTNTEVMQSKQILQEAGFKDDKPYIVMAIGTNWSTKNWPAEYFALLADRIYNRGIIPVVIGGIGDEYLLKRLIQHTNVPLINLIGKTSLKQLAAIIRGADAFVGGDTGPMHLAAALGVSTVALMGPTDPVRNGPYGAGHKTIMANRKCIGCWQHKCPKAVDCLAAISVNEVIAALEEILNFVVQKTNSYHFQQEMTKNISKM